MAVMTFTENSFSPLASSSKNTQKFQKISPNKKNGETSSAAKGVRNNVHVPQSVDARRTKPMNEIQGILVLDLNEGDVEKDADWLIRKNGKNIPIMDTILEDEEVGELLQFTKEDVQKDVDFWNQSVFCYILGATPPWEVIEDFVFRVWDEYGVDRVSFMDNGIFIVRFKHPNQREALLKSGYYLFETKPVIVKPWNVDVELVKAEVDAVQVWVKLTGIPLKFRGDCLPSIAGLVGTYIKKDEPTAEKIRLSFARVMVELKMGQKLPSKVHFLDESGKVVEVGVSYDSNVKL